MNVMAPLLIENRTFDEIGVGESASVTRTLTEQDIQLFALVSGDVNPAHGESSPPSPVGSMSRATSIARSTPAGPSATAWGPGRRIIGGNSTRSVTYISPAKPILTWVNDAGGGDAIPRAHRGRAK
jgi:hypothetical protein